MPVAGWSRLEVEATVSSYFQTLEKGLKGEPFRESREKLIEVKTTKFGEYTPFYVSSNEVNVSQIEKSRYHLYRLFEFGRQPKMFAVPGALDTSFKLEPNSFVARVN
jgi:hypothetical protein